MDADERTWFDGFITALLFVQAHHDREGGSQTLETHLPDERWTGKEWVKIEDFEQKFTKVLEDLDDEGGITCHRFKTVHNDQYDYDYRVVEIGGSEGHFGMPEWD